MLVLPTLVKAWLRCNPQVLVEFKFVEDNVYIEFWSPDHAQKFGRLHLTPADQRLLIKSFAFPDLFTK